MWTRLFGGVLAAAGVVGAAACSTPAPVDGLRPVTANAEHVPSAGLDLATMSGVWGHRQTQIERAMQRASNTCLERHGFEPQGAAAEINGFDEASTVDLPRRQAVGYGLRTDAAPPAREPVDATEQHYLSGLSSERREDYLSTLVGSGGPSATIRLPDGREIQTPETGCIAEGRVAVFGTIQNWAQVQYLPEALSSLVSNQVVSSPEYTQALGRWRTCMEIRGFKSRDPESLRTAVSAEPHSRTSETRAAVADGECALEAHLPRAALDARRRLLDTKLTSDQRHLLVRATDAWLTANTANTGGRAVDVTAESS